MKLKISLGILALLVIAAFAYSNYHFGKFAISDDIAKVREKALRYIPIGSSIDQAQQIMETDKFECEKVLRGDFIEQQYFHNQVEHKGMSFLHCSKRLAWNIGCDGHWQIAFVDQDGKVADVLVSFIATCI